jgi:dipeptidyl aminopeptidase/acylaminoacyl peptidase
MNAKMIYPPGFSENTTKKYPVMMECYGGPFSQKASKEFDVGFMDQIAMKDVIVLIVDGRGTGFKGRTFRSAVSKQLGKLEALDQVAAARWVGTLPYVDATKIGIWGWSYGGFLTSKVIETDSGVFKLGIAVAPVTDWKFYDTAYTERYMKTPEENKIGYIESGVRKMNGFRNAKFLLMHGTADGKLNHLYR